MDLFPLFPAHTVVIRIGSNVYTKPATVPCLCGGYTLAPFSLPKELISPLSLFSRGNRSSRIFTLFLLEYGE